MPRSSRKKTKMVQRSRKLSRHGASRERTMVKERRRSSVINIPSGPRNPMVGETVRSQSEPTLLPPIDDSTLSRQSHSYSSIPPTRNSEPLKTPTIDAVGVRSINAYMQQLSFNGRQKTLPGLAERPVRAAQDLGEAATVLGQSRPSLREDRYSSSSSARQPLGPRQLTTCMSPTKNFHGRVVPPGETRLHEDDVARSIRRKIEQFRNWHEENYKRKLSQLKLNYKPARSKKTSAHSSKHEQIVEESVQNLEEEVGQVHEEKKVVQDLDCKQYTDTKQNKTNEEKLEIVEQQSGWSEMGDSRSDATSKSRTESPPARLDNPALYRPHTARTWRTWRDPNDSYAYTNVQSYIDQFDLMSMEKIGRIKKWVREVNRARNIGDEFSTTLDEELESETEFNFGKPELPETDESCSTEHAE